MTVPQHLVRPELAEIDTGPAGDQRQRTFEGCVFAVFVELPLCLGIRLAENFRLASYAIPRGCIAGYSPEANVLVPLSSAGEESDTPTSKSVLVSLRRRVAVAA